MYQHFLFLDFDGVLHLDADTHDDPFNQLDNFCAALRRGDPRQRIGIVISSAWRYTETLDELRGHFPQGIQNRILDMTPDLNDYYRDPAGSRQREIEHWMQANAPQGHWLAIDDRANYFDAGCANLFHVPDWAPPMKPDLQEPFSIMRAVEQYELSEPLRSAQATQNYIALMQQFQRRLIDFLLL
jgi:hypothetical protein